MAALPSNPETTDSRLLSLPGELRDIIWTDVLAPTKHIVLRIDDINDLAYHLEACYSDYKPVAPPSPSRVSLALCRVSKKVLEETAHLAWTKNLFSICADNETSFMTIIWMMDATWLEHVHNVQLLWSMHSLESIRSILSLLRKCPNLKTLTLRNGRYIREKFYLDRPQDFTRCVYCRGRIAASEWSRRPYARLLPIMETVKDFGAEREIPIKVVFDDENLKKEWDAGIKDMFSVLHATFGGQLWFNGKLYLEEEQLPENVDGALDHQVDSEDNS